jgi:hypothetical protein
MPVGQSTPSLLGITLLAPPSLHAAALSAPAGHPGFARLLHPLIASTIFPELRTPPPRPLI